MTRPDGATPEGIHDLAGNVWEWVMPNWFEPGTRNKDFRAGTRYVSIGFRVVWATSEGRD